MNDHWLYLVRHGENRANLTKEFSHRAVDYPLTPKGRLQAQQTAAYFANRAVDVVFSSPLKRASETAEIIARHVHAPLVVVEALREVNVGSLEHSPPNAATWAMHDDIVNGWFGGQPERAFPGGENYVELCARYQLALDHMLGDGAALTRVVVGHGGMFTFCMSDLCPGVTRQALRAVPNHNCSVSQVRVRQQAGRWSGQLVSWAELGHLSGEAAQFVLALPSQAELSKMPAVRPERGA